MPTEKREGEPCPVCQFTARKVEGDHLYCSEFCDLATDEELALFKNREPGLWAVWPCPRCGRPTEGEYEPPDLICVACDPLDKLDKRTALLDEAQKELHRLWAHLTDLYRITYDSRGHDSNPELSKVLTEKIDKALGVTKEDGKRTTQVYELRERIKDELGLIPSNMAEAMRLLDKMLSDEDRETIQKAKNVDDVIIRLHHGFGTYLRNEWRLWHGSKMAKHLEGLGVTHPDDMSHYILRHYANDRIKTWHQRVADDDSLVVPGEVEGQ